MEYIKRSDLMRDYKHQSEEVSKSPTKVLFDELYEEIKHGDEEHQKWLKDKIEDFVKRRVV